MNSKPLDDAQIDLEEAIQAFKKAPSADTLDDVYRATTAIELACRAQVEVTA